MAAITLTKNDKKDIYGHAHITLLGTVKDGDENELIEYVRTHNDNDAKRLVVLINIIKANPDNIKLQVEMMCGKNYIKNLPLMCYILKYLFRSEDNLKMLMEEMYDEKEEMDDSSYVLGCNMLKTVYKHKDMIFSEKIITIDLTA